MNNYNEIYNLNMEDTLIIQEFINMYEAIEQKYKVYCILCDSIRKNIIFQNNKEDNLSLEENIKQIKQKLTQEKTNSDDEYRKQLLEKQIQNLNEQLEQIKIYFPIEQIYNEMYYGNIQRYFTKEKEKEKTTVEYNIKDELLEKDYYYNKKSTITQIYIRLKYLNDFYKKSNKEKIGMDIEFLRNNVKFYEIFKKAIISFIKQNKNKILETVKNIETNTIKNQEHIERIK